MYGRICAWPIGKCAQPTVIEWETSQIWAVVPLELLLTSHELLWAFSTCIVSVSYNRSLLYCTGGISMKRPLFLCQLSSSGPFRLVSFLVSMFFDKAIEDSRRSSSSYAFSFHKPGFSCIDFENKSIVT